MAQDKAKIRLSKAEYQRKYRKARKHYNLYYEKDEHDIIAKNASTAELPIAKYLKDVTLKKKVVGVDPSRKNILLVKSELRRIGVNVNQIAKAFNDPYGARDVDDFNKTLKGMTEKLVSILNELQTR